MKLELEGNIIHFKGLKIGRFILTTETQLKNITIDTKKINVINNGKR